MPFRPRPILVAILAALLALAAHLPAAGQSQLDPYLEVTGTTEVLEGDRLMIDGRTVRLYGIDAPDPGQTCVSGRGQSFDCGAGARNMLTRLTAGRSVECTVYADLPDLDAMAATCRADGVDLGAMMVRLGWAYPQRGLSHRYERLESIAQTAGAGLWSGRAERPWHWRARQAP